MPFDQATRTKFFPTVQRFLSPFNIFEVSIQASAIYGPPSIWSIAWVRPTGIFCQWVLVIARPFSAPVIVKVIGRTPAGSPKSPTRSIVCRSFFSSGGKSRAQAGLAVVPSSLVIRKSVGATDAGSINQLKVTGTLSKPLPPLGQELPPFKPHEALRIFAVPRLKSELLVAAAEVAIGINSRHVTRASTDFPNTDPPRLMT